MEQISRWPKAPHALWGDGENLSLAFADGLAHLDDGSLQYWWQEPVDRAAPGNRGDVYVSQRGRILRLDPAAPQRCEDLTDDFGAHDSETRRIRLDDFGQIHVEDAQRIRRLDGSFAEAPPFEGATLLPLGADLCGNLWSLSADGASCHLMPAQTPGVWQSIPLPTGTWPHLVIDHAGFVWIGGRKGLRRFDPRQHPPQWQTPDGTGAVTALGCSPAGLAMAAMETGEVIEIDLTAADDTIQRTLASTSSPVRQLHTDTTGLVWLATDDGLLRLDTEASESHRYWRQAPGRLPGGGNHDIFTAACGGRLYAAGGLLRFRGYPTSQHCFGELFSYDPASEFWWIANPLPFPRRYNGIATLDDRVWLVGGEGVLDPATDVTVLDVVDIYDPATGRWQQGPSLRHTRTDPFVAACAGRIWAAAGSGDGTSKLQSMESIGPGETAWRREPDLPAPAREGGCCALDDILYCASLDGFFAFDTRTGQWDLNVPPPDTLVKAPLMTAWQGEVWMMGGAREDRTRIYDPAGRSWREGPRLPTQQSWGGAAVLDGQLIITAGAHRSDRHDMTIYDDRTWILR